MRSPDLRLPIRRRQRFGYIVTITGANGYSATGQAVLDYSWANPYAVPCNQIVSNRDQL